jgi:xylan 1,4-beta-xylosidase
MYKRIGVLQFYQQNIYQTSNIETGPWTSSVLNSYYHDASLLFDNRRVFLVYGSDDIRIIELTADAKAIRSGGLNQVIIPTASNIAGSSFILKAQHKLDGYRQHASNVIYNATLYGIPCFL